jgi:hypothetical protein
MWRVDLIGADANTKARWTKLKIPAALVNYRNQSRDEKAVGVDEGGNGTLRVFWLVDECNADTDRCLDVLYQAESHDAGKSWRLYHSGFTTYFGMSEVEQLVMVDRLHGWMMLANRRASPLMVPTASAVATVCRPCGSAAGSHSSGEIRWGNRNSEISQCKGQPKGRAERMALLLSFVVARTLS